MGLAYSLEIQRGNDNYIVNRGIALPSFNAYARRNNATSTSTSTSPLQFLRSFRDDYEARCRQKFDAESLFGVSKMEWDAHNVCQDKWIMYKDVGSFTDADFMMPPPRHLTYQSDNNRSYVEDNFSNNASHLSIPRRYCVLEREGYFHSNGLLFDCHNTYPLLVKKEREDVNMVMKRTDYPKIAFMQVFEVKGPLLSVVIPFSSAFSHAAAIGLLQATQFLTILAANANAAVLVPKDGPLFSLMEALGVPTSQIIIANEGQLWYSKQAMLFINEPPFNILQAHYPGNMANGRISGGEMEKENGGGSANQQQQDGKQNRRESGIRELIKEFLQRKGYFNLTDLKMNQVLYLWRGGAERVVQDQETLVSLIRNSLRSDLELYVEGKEAIRYSSEASKTAWMSTASRFVNAVAVIGPHGGAFGNMFLTHSDTLIIEFNLPWSAGVASDTKVRPGVRDQLYASARAMGLGEHYWYVWPKDAHRIGTMFYHNRYMTVDFNEVMDIMRRSGLLKNETS